MIGPDEHVGVIFAALADPTRRRLLELLEASPDSSATTLAARLPVTRQAVVQHLTVLGGAGLVASRKVGRQVLFTVQPYALGIAASWLTARTRAWQRSLQALKYAAETGKATASQDRPDDAAVDP
ncbi:ArsR/SmtB family transcription factor [Fodinicola acaciae]|uniref:ArsR/SmtB family transcription factor n=1 Tax=Fodinicola acaciae TaxID=2681555 RepID=UPI0013D5691B|nr:metalloregulator ArsR/SmtB family transcription factor [Fodinicola acaciae]